MARMSELALQIQDYEEGLLDEEQTIELFQTLVDTGMIHSLQGSYQRTAMELSRRGDISPIEWRARA